MHQALDMNGNIVFAHIGFNMLTLWMFGSDLENLLGPEAFSGFLLYRMWLICRGCAVID